LEARSEMLSFHLEGRPLAPDTDIELLAETLIAIQPAICVFLWMRLPATHLETASPSLVSRFNPQWHVLSPPWHPKLRLNINPLSKEVSELVLPRAA